MSIPVIICDDSSMARKQLARTLPSDWDASISFAANGEEALEALEKGLGEVMFLDLTMPVLDGYGTLQAIKDRQLDVMVVVVSGDVQEEAYRRVMALGAMEFIKKPASAETLQELLSRYGLYSEDTRTTADGGIEGNSSSEASAVTQANDQGSDQGSNQEKAKVDLNDPAAQFDSYREIINVAMGRAGSLLARLTGEFVQLPIPKVAMLEPSELHMALSFAGEEQVSAVCQGFIARGIAGEALLLFSDASFSSLAKLMKYKGAEDSDTVDDSLQIEVLTDVSGALLGAILNGLGDQLDLSFSQGYPSVLGRHTNIGELINTSHQRWQKTLTIEVTYTLENYDIVCDVLLLFTPDSIDAINYRLDYFLND